MAGRPNKSQVVGVRFAADQIKSLDRTAKRAGVTRADAIRRGALAAPHLELVIDTLGCMNKASVIVLAQHLAAEAGSDYNDLPESAREGYIGQALTDIDAALEATDRMRRDMAHIDRLLGTTRRELKYQSMAKADAMLAETPPS